MIYPNSISAKPGVYLFRDKRNEIIYIGKSVSLRKRIQQYFRPSLKLGPKTEKMVSEVSKVDVRIVKTEIEALLLETALIKKYKPRYNVSWKDDKGHLYIKINLTPQIPVIETARRQLETPQIKLYGPFPSASTVRQVLKTLRKIFPYCQHKRQQKSCLWVHLGLCPDPYHTDPLKYKKNIKNIMLFLGGKKKVLLFNLKREMRLLSNNQKFEDALKIKKQVEAIEYITSVYVTPDEYLKRPSLAEDFIYERLHDLKEFLNLPKNPKRIEAYDISNIQGKMATGSMVVFVNGEKTPHEYRRFRIRSKETPDDISMMKEVIRRRFLNNWPLPDLIVIDGGKPQLNASLNALEAYSFKIPIISLAKKNEDIYLPGKSLPLKLNQTSPGLQLLRQTRDEAHRFALIYHRKLRSKKFLTRSN